MAKDDERRGAEEAEEEDIKDLSSSVLSVRMMFRQTKQRTTRGPQPDASRLFIRLCQLFRLQFRRIGVRWKRSWKIEWITVAQEQVSLSDPLLFGLTCTGETFAAIDLHVCSLFYTNTCISQTYVDNMPICIHVTYITHIAFLIHNAYMHTYIDTYIHTYVRTYVRTYVHTHTYACMHLLLKSMFSKVPCIALGALGASPSWFLEQRRKSLGEREELSPPKF